MNYECFVSLIVILFVKINFVYLSPIVGGIVPTTHDDFSFSISLQVRNGTEGVATDEGTIITTTTCTDSNDLKFSDYKHFCGGTYLRNGWILTASHCVIQINLAKTDVFAVIGERNLRTRQANMYPVIKIIAKNYDRYTYEDDVALLKVDTSVYGEPIIPQPVIISNIPLNLSVKETDVCYLFGYGSTEFNGDPTLDLRIGPNHVISQTKCERDLGKYMAPEQGSSMFCAEGFGSNGQVDACQGDSGGSLICKRNNKFVAIGITSYGAGCGVPGMPGVYTSVPDHADWINNITANL